MVRPPSGSDIDLQTLKKTTDVFLDVASNHEIPELIATIRYLQERDGDVTKSTLQEALSEPLKTREALHLTRHLRQYGYTGSGATTQQTRALHQVEYHAHLLQTRSRSNDPELVATLPDDESISASEFESILTESLELIKKADDRLWLVSPYLSEEAFGKLKPALQTAVNQGATISLLTRYLTYGDDDSEYNREFARRLMDVPELAANTRLYEYINEETWDTFHAKVIIADQEQAYLGTANVTHKGFLSNLELGVLFQGEPVIHLANLFESLRDSPHLYQVTQVSDGFRRGK